MIIVFPSPYLWSFLQMHLMRYLPIDTAMPSFVIVNGDAPGNVYRGNINIIIIPTDEFSF